MLPLFGIVAVLASTFTDVEFVAGDPALLVARIASVKPATDNDWASLLEVEVENRGVIPGEPITFEFYEAGTGDAHAKVFSRWTRTDLPHYGRAGRVVAPSATLTFPAVVTQPPGLAKKIKVRVARASFANGAVAVASPLAIVSRRSAKERDPEENRDVDTTFVRVSNALDHPVDAVFLVRFGKKGVGLARGRAEAFKTTEIRLRGAMLADDRPFANGEPTDVDLVDWSIDSEAHASAQPLMDAMAAMIGIDPTAAATARLRIDVTGSHVFNFTGTVRVGTSVEFVPPATLSAENSPLAVRSVHAALRYVRRDPILLRSVESAVLVALDDIAVYRVNDFALNGMKVSHVGLKSGQIVWWAFDPAPFGLWDEIAMTQLGAGFVFGTRIAHAAYQDVPTGEERWTYAQAGGLPLPIAYASAERAPALKAESFVRITFDEWRIDDAPAAGASNAAPTGSGVDALRAAWSAPYAMPSRGVTISGAFALENAGNDLSWMGQRKVSGIFRLVGVKSTGWDSWTVNVDKPKVTKEATAVLASVVEDRLRLFVWRDPAFRGSFDDEFRGAKIETDGSGFTIAGGAMTRIDLADGRPSRIAFADGRVRTIRWTQCQGQWVASEVKTGDETITWTWTALAPDVLWPSKVEMRGVFEKWGPETIAFTKLK